MKQMSRIPIYLLLLATFFIAACNKPSVEPPKKTPLELLTGSAWALDELRFLQNNTPQYYKRGGSNNTHDFSQEMLVFKSDNTGIKYESYGTEPFTWSFVSDDKTKIKITLQESPTLEIMWENLVYDDDLITYTEYYKRQGVNSLAVGKRTPVALPSGKANKL